MPDMKFNTVAWQDIYESKSGRNIDDKPHTMAIKTDEPKIPTILRLVILIKSRSLNKYINSENKYVWLIYWKNNYFWNWFIYRLLRFSFRLFRKQLQAKNYIWQYI